MEIYTKALIATVIIFVSGIGIGMLIEEYRVRDINRNMLELQSLYNDGRLLAMYIASLNKSYCNEMLKRNLEYNSKIYQFGAKLDEYERLNRFTPELEEQQKLYNLLQFQFLLNSIKLKKECNFTYFNVIHLYRKKNVTLKEEVDTKTMGGILWDLKMKCGNKVMLIPLRADANQTSVAMFVHQYNISRYPATIIDGRVIEGLVSLSELNEITKC